VPVGLICSLVCWQFLKSRESPTQQLKMDRVGLFLLIIWVGSLQVMLDQGKDLDWFNSKTIITLCIVCIVCLAVWIIWELTERAPIVDLTLFKSRSFTLGTLTLCLVYGVFFGNVVLMPLWLQSNLNYTATWAGIVTAPSGITALLAAPLVGKYIGRYDARWFATASFVIFAVSYFMRAAYPPDGSFWVFAMPALVQGVAMGIFFVALITIALDRLPPERIPAASGLNNFLRITASGFATSLTTTYWDRRERFHQSRLVESLSVFDPTLREVTTTIKGLGFSDHGAAAKVLNEVINQGFLLSSLDLFYFSGWATLILIATCWLVRRPAAKAVVAGE
jgi:MFS transporter, DHA2 family, multidrug resistance protein